MPYTVQAIGPGDMAAGFALAGVPVMEVSSTDEGVARLAEALGRDDIGVLLADESIIKAMPEDLRRRALRKPTPVLVPVPRPRWEGREEDIASYILDLLQRAIGYRMRLK